MKRGLMGLEAAAAAVITVAVAGCLLVGMANGQQQQADYDYNYNYLDDMPAGDTSDPTGIERLWLQEQLKEQVLSGKPFANLFGDGESMEKKTSRIKERFLPEWLRNSVLTVRNRFRRRWLNEDIPEEDYYSEEDVSDRRQGSFRRQLSPAARAYNSLFPSLLLGGLGGLGVYTFSQKIDEAEMNADDAFYGVKDNVERRLMEIEAAQNVKKKEQKKLDFV